MGSAFLPGHPAWATLLLWASSQAGAKGRGEQRWRCRWRLHGCWAGRKRPRVQAAASGCGAAGPPHRSRPVPHPLRQIGALVAWQLRLPRVIGMLCAGLLMQVCEGAIQRR